MSEWNLMCGFAATHFSFNLFKDAFRGNESNIRHFSEWEDTHGNLLIFQRWFVPSLRFIWVAAIHAHTHEWMNVSNYNRIDVFVTFEERPKAPQSRICHGMSCWWLNYYYHVFVHNNNKRSNAVLFADSRTCLRLHPAVSWYHKSDGLITSPK